MFPGLLLIREGYEIRQDDISPIQGPEGACFTKALTQNLRLHTFLNLIKYKMADSVTNFKTLFESNTNKISEKVLLDCYDWLYSILKCMIEFRFRVSASEKTQNPELF